MECILHKTLGLRPHAARVLQGGTRFAGPGANLAAALVVLLLPWMPQRELFATDTDGGQLCRLLYQRWKSQRHEVVTLEATLSHIIYSAMKDAKSSFGFDAVTRLVSDGRITDGASAVEFCKKFPVGLWQKLPSPFHVNLYQDGQSVSNIWPGEGDARVVHEGANVFSRSDKQINLYGRNEGERVLGLYDLRLIPLLEGDWTEKDLQFLEQRPDDNILVNLGRRRALVNPKSGFIHRWESSGAVGDKTVVYQLHEWRIAEGLSFPKCVILATFNKDQLDFMTIDVIDKLTVNGNIDPSVFRVKGRAGARVVDMRRNRTEPTVFGLIEDVDDIVRYADHRLTQPVPPAIHASSPMERPILILVGVALAAGVVLLVKLRRRSQEGSSSP